jgi:hypothetical protein
MKNSKVLIARLRQRLSQDKITETEFTIALAEILAATTDRLSGADAMLMSQEIHQLEQAWRDSRHRPVN